MFNKYTMCIHADILINLQANCYNNIGFNTSIQTAPPIKECATRREEMATASLESSALIHLRRQLHWQDRRFHHHMSLFTAHISRWHIANRCKLLSILQEFLVPSLYQYVRIMEQSSNIAKRCQFVPGQALPISLTQMYPAS